mmetsp:Transcript_1665/g.3654  ORF Transcript_1665/g.3654 Transcript_1665/m.3654 type:complete len:113 (+) Transcript_1665:1491-1829(+)
MRGGCLPARRLSSTTAAHLLPCLSSLCCTAYVCLGVHGHGGISTRLQRDCRGEISAAAGEEKRWGGQTGSAESVPAGNAVATHSGAQGVGSEVMGHSSYGRLDPTTLYGRLC